MNRFILDRRFWVLPLLAWTLVIAASFAWNWRELDARATDLAQERALFVFRMVESVRLWNARHGGVYAPVTADSPPNPYLDTPEREITTPSGRLLTKVNPAYMTRQLTAIVDELAEIQVRLTSLKPLNPANAPDAWEAEALRALEDGAPHVAVRLGAGADERFRYMGPLRVQQPCMQCHAHQGYAIGDLRGGIAVNFPMAPLLGTQALQKRNIWLIHLAVWLLLSGLTLYALQRFRGQMQDLHAAKAQQDALVDQRTAELQHEVADRIQAEAYLRLFIESSGEGILGIDAEGRCTLVNAEALRMLGYTTADELIGRPIHTLIHHSTADGTPIPAERCRLLATIARGTSLHADDDVFWRRDDSHFPVEYRSHPLLAGEDIIGAVITFTDVSERKASEAQLRKLSLAVEHSPASAIITDVDGRIEYVNQRFTEITGYTSEEVVGKNPRLWQSGQTSPKTYQRLWNAIKSGETWYGEMLNKRKDGHLFWEESRISPIRDESGRITHFVAVKQDITERKEHEQHIWHQANFDGLTGLPNRELFRARLEQALSDADELGHLVALLYVDLDGFKDINDRHGHEAGDRVLHQVAERLTATVRESDTVARLGGDEFAVILHHIPKPHAAERVASKILDQLSAEFDVNDARVRVSASVGIALYPEHAGTSEQLLNRADEAMYLAKQGGRNTYRFHLPTN
ncbi:MAG: diguanylate cyclase [Chromatiales bacterium]|nr:diguanylate cyclase [Chromatiales bacterium]